MNYDTELFEILNQLKKMSANLSALLVQLDNHLARIEGKEDELSRNIKEIRKQTDKMYNLYKSNGVSSPDRIV